MWRVSVYAERRLKATTERFDDRKILVGDLCWVFDLLVESLSGIDNLNNQFGCLWFGRDGARIDV
jgi:hypothetical protein